MLEARTFIRLFRQEQFFIFLGAIILIILAWAYIFHLSLAMPIDSMNPKVNVLTKPQTNYWGSNDLLSALLMWFIMMTAMMLPSAMPMILIFSAYNKKRLLEGNQFVPTWIFVLGYLLIWFGFSILTTVLQFVLHNAAIISIDMKVINPFISGLILIGAGIYQFAPIKNVCVKNCQSPFGFIMENWREGKIGSLIMGLHHGLYCVGCCWALMLLLFAAGIMNLLWIAVISIFVFLEKTARGYWLGRIAGLLLAVWGFVMIIAY